MSLHFDPSGRKIGYRNLKKTCGFCDDNEEEEYFEQIGGGEEEEEEENQELYTESPTVEETTDTTDEYPDPEDAESHTMSPEESTTRLKKSRSCVDFGHDCKEKLHLCHNVIYSGLMTRMCQRSCKLCDSNVKRGSVSSGGINSLALLLNCGDASSDCQQRISYCHNPQYSQLMSQMCRKTCSMC
uniref:ShKT domain-containing protein n=1 Tax=Ascaris lumbricoides TaxID=6252 RepID=A0A0M3IHD1_ASCLU